MIKGGKRSNHGGKFLEKQALYTSTQLEDGSILRMQSKNDHDIDTFGQNDIQ